MFSRKNIPVTAMILVDLTIFETKFKLASSRVTTKVNVTVSLKCKSVNDCVYFGSLYRICIRSPNHKFAEFCLDNAVTPWYNRLVLVSDVPKYSLVLEIRSFCPFFMTLHVISTDPPKTPFTGSGVTCSDCPFTKTK